MSSFQFPNPWLAWPVVALLALSWLAWAYRLRRSPRRELRTVILEAAALLFVQAGGLWAGWPFLDERLTGMGDSYHYGLQLSDALAQWREGVFPVLVGQSEYAFNGNVHTLRTAPYFVHVGGALALLTGGRFGVVALQNLTLVLSMLGGALTAYHATRQLAPGRIWGPALLAICYIGSAGLLSPLYHYDMLATALTAPWQPLFWLGLIRSWERLDDQRGILLAAFANAILWSVHPPTAAWLLVPLAISESCRLVVVGRAPGSFRRVAIAAAVWCVVAAYTFYSVLSLRLEYSLSAGGNMPRSILANLEAAWPDSLVPLAKATTPLADLQLGYTLWGVLLLGLVFGLGRRPVSWFLVLITLIYLLLLIPIPGVTFWLWQQVPHALLDLTNDWPMQRLYPILAGLAIAVGAVALRGRRGMYFVAVTLLCVGATWSIAEASRLLQRAVSYRRTAETTAQEFRLDQFSLTRSSYLLFGRFPPYFSHGYMDPRFEVRLLDETGRVAVDNAHSLLAASAVNPPEFQDVAPETQVATDGVHDYLLHFRFSPTAAGVVIAKALPMELAYQLPHFGEALSFGAGPTNQHTLPVRMTKKPPQLLTIASSATGTAVQVLPFKETDLPLRIKGFIPLTVTFETPHAGRLETPRMFIPGYAATVNGKPATVQRSDAGLVTVPVPAGANEVVVSYPGPTELSTTFYVSLGGMLIAGVLLMRRELNDRSDAPHEPLDAAAIRAHHLFRWKS